jgi:hypothetical protein
MTVGEFCESFAVRQSYDSRVTLVDASTFPTYSLNKQEQYRQIIVKAMLSKDDPGRREYYNDQNDVRDFLNILAGSSSLIDLVLNGMPTDQSPNVHVFDFPSMEAKEGADYYETLARNDGFSLDFGVLQTIEALCLAAKELETWTNGRTVKILWGETKLQVAHSGAFSRHTNPYRSRDQIPKTVGHSCVREAYNVMFNGPCTNIESKATRPKLDSMQKVRDEVLSLLRTISWPKESDKLGIGHFLFRGPKGKVFLLLFAHPLVFV